MCLNVLTVWVLREGTELQLVAGGQQPGPANYELRRRQKRAPNGHENQGRPKHKAIPLVGPKEKKKAAAGKINQCGETPRLKGMAFPFRGWRAERKGMASLCRLQNLAASGRWKKKSAKGKRQPTNETRRGKTKVFPLLFRLSPPRKMCRRFFVKKNKGENK